MRKIVKFATIIAAVILLICCSTIAALAVDETPIDYEALFAKANEVDGAYADSHAIVLADCYEQDPSTFITNLSLEDEDTIDNVVHLLVYEFQYRDMDDFKSTFIRIQEDDTSSTSEKNIAISVFECIEAFNAPPEIDDSLPLYTFTDHSFNTRVVRKIIDANLDINATDEGFYMYLSKMYQRSPSLFAEMISDMPQETIIYLGECIAYDMLKNNVSPPCITTEQSTALALLSNSITTTVANDDPIYTVDQELVTINEISAPTSISATVPSISSLTFTYDTSNAQVGDRVYITATIEDTANQFSFVIYYVELYEILEGQNLLVGGGALAIPTGSTQASYEFSKIFDSAGEKSFYVKVYSEGKTSFLNQRYFFNLLDIYGFWTISVELPSVRSNLGCLTLFDASGTEFYQAICLGCSAESRPASETNGHTPTGVYSGTLIGPMSDTAAYGPYKCIDMEGISGDIVTYSHRTEIWIHGGRDGVTSSTASHYPLAKTNGCVRVTSQFQQILVQTIEDWISNGFHYATGEITITEATTQTVEHPTSDPWYVELSI